MKKALKILILVAIAALVLYGINTLRPQTPAINPDPNHTHADFAVWVNGTELDFSADKYMMTEAEEEAAPAGSPKKYFHLHDGDGHVIHMHKPEIGIGDFFETIGLKMTGACFILDDTQFETLDSVWVKDFARTKRLCNDGKFHWTMVVNGTARMMDPAFSFADGDKILLSYSAGDYWSMEWKQMTDDACRYSKTCPWKGPAPTESCISDPTVPCKE